MYPAVVLVDLKWNFSWNWGTIGYRIVSGQIIIRFSISCTRWTKYSHLFRPKITRHTQKLEFISTQIFCIFSADIWEVLWKFEVILRFFQRRYFSYNQYCFRMLKRTYVCTLDDKLRHRTFWSRGKIIFLLSRKECFFFVRTKIISKLTVFLGGIEYQLTW